MNCVCSSSEKKELKTNPKTTAPHTVTRTTSAANDTLLFTKPKSYATTRPTKPTVMPPMDGSEFVVPNIAHFTWYTQLPKEFLFHHLLSILSVYRMMKAEKIYFHCNFQPVGKYWDEARSKVPNLIIKGVDPPKSLFGVDLKARVNDATDSDADRLRILQEYGGLYIDLDVLILRSLDPLRRFPTTLGKLSC